jgi:sialate O-acetylesterase
MQTAWGESSEASSASSPTAPFEANRLFSDNMVLQRDVKAPVWGTAAPGATVAVQFRGTTASAVTDRDGKWVVKIGPFDAGGPFEMVIESGDAKQTIKNVLVGDVWFCAGQSNMEWPVKNAKDGKKEAQAANYPQIRLFTVKHAVADAPVANLEEGEWTECSPETIADFSATAYYFGRHLHRELNVPIALINASWGGTAVRSWTGIEALRANDGFAGTVRMYDGFLRQYEKDLAKGVIHEQDGYYKDPGIQDNERGLASPDLDDSEWKQTKLPNKYVMKDGATWVRKEVDIPASWAGQDLELRLGHIVSYDVTYFNGVEVGRVDRAILKTDRSLVRRAYRVPADLVKPGGSNVIAVRVFVQSSYSGGILGFPDWIKPTFAIRTGDKKNTISLAGAWKMKTTLSLPSKYFYGYTTHHLPSGLFNAMLCPVTPFGIRGVIWYQGENDVHNAWEYRTLFPTMIESWRKQWGQGDLPFLFVQLPNLSGPSKNTGDDLPGNDSWLELREAQLMALSVSNTAMVVAIDIGEQSIHPANKQDVGLRLGLAAQAVAYGQEVEYSGPIYKSMKVEGNAIRLTFDHVGGELVARGGDPLTWFAIAGDDQNFVQAQARIDGDTIVVSSDQVPSPMSVRYAWALHPKGCNLFNRAGLPASPFRTDDWPQRTTGRRYPR